VFKTKVRTSNEGRDQPAIGRAGGAVTGLTTASSEALAVAGRNRVHDLGRVAVGLAVMQAQRGEAIAELAVACNESESFGPVASDVTA
jgi:hypothetical protein